jgi:hypothetical protein
LKIIKEMGRKNKGNVKIFCFAFFMIFFIGNVSATLNVSFSDQGTDVASRSTGELLESGDLSVTVWDALSDGNLIYNETFTGAIVNGSWNVMLGENSSNSLSLEFGKTYFKDYEIDGEDANFTNLTGSVVDRQFFYSPLGDITDDDISDSTNLTLGQKITFAFEEAIDNIIDGWIRITGGLNVTENVEVGGNVTANYFIGDGSQLTNIPGSVSVINFTNSDYDGNVTNGSLTGYEAANNICDSEFSGAHMCTQHEVSSYIALVGAASLSVSQISWVIAGGAKYAPADHPVNDCSGFTNDGTGATDPLGSFWSFNNINGGKGIAGNCGLSYPLACCK